MNWNRVYDKIERDCLTSSVTFAFNPLLEFCRAAFFSSTKTFEPFFVSKVVRVVVLGGVGSGPFAYPKASWKLFKNG
ncbi:hypothetical protein [Mucilaginibacter sp. R-33]|uniref:hypothetical protein n=1 Tax=Mucilaginibacter sp. R-33 TaxID=3416711 RepID=UPI003CEAF523